MWYAFAIFIAAALALAGFLGYKLTKLRAGTAAMSADAQSTLLPFSIRETEHRIRKEVRTKTRLALLYALRYSVFGMHYMKRKFDKAVAKVHRIAAHHEKRIVSAHIEESQPGAFLGTIQEYKLTVPTPTPTAKVKKPRAPRKPRTKAVPAPAAAVPVDTETSPVEAAAVTETVSIK